MKRTITGLIIGLMCMGGAASAHVPEMKRTIEARQAALMLSGVALGAIKSSIDAGQPSATQAFNIRALGRWARLLPEMFPEGSGSEAGVPTRAKAEIWANRADFDAKAAAYVAAVDRLGELGRGEDQAAFAAQWAEVRNACQACHEAYRGPAA